MAKAMKAMKATRLWSAAMSKAMKATNATAMKTMKAEAKFYFWIAKTKAKWFRGAEKGIQNQRAVCKMIRRWSDETLERLIA